MNLPQKTIKDKFKTFTKDIQHFSEVQSELPRLIAYVKNLRNFQNKFIIFQNGDKLWLKELC